MFGLHEGSPDPVLKGPGFVPVHQGRCDHVSVGQEDKYDRVLDLNTDVHLYERAATAHTSKAKLQDRVHDG